MIWYEKEILELKARVAALEQQLKTYCVVCGEDAEVFFNNRPFCAKCGKIELIRRKQNAKDYVCST